MPRNFRGGSRYRQIELLRSLAQRYDWVVSAGHAGTLGTAGHFCTLVLWLGIAGTTGCWAIPAKDFFAACRLAV